MNKCLRIHFSMDKIPTTFLRSVIKKYAEKFELEGTAQTPNNSDNVRIIVCGLKDSVDDFVDMIHKNSSKYPIKDLTIEPFVRNKDYRNVFRIIE